LAVMARYEEGVHDDNSNRLDIIYRTVRHPYAIQAKIHVAALAPKWNEMHGIHLSYPDDTVS